MTNGDSFGGTRTSGRFRVFCSRLNQWLVSAIATESVAVDSQLSGRETGSTATFVAPSTAASSSAAGTGTRPSSCGTSVAAAAEFGSAIASAPVSASGPREFACRLDAGPATQDISGTSRWTDASSRHHRQAAASLTSPMLIRRICAPAG